MRKKDLLRPLLLSLFGLMGTSQLHAQSTDKNYYYDILGNGKKCYTNDYGLREVDTITAYVYDSKTKKYVQDTTGVTYYSKNVLSRFWTESKKISYFSSFVDLNRDGKVEGINYDYRNKEYPYCGILLGNGDGTFYAPVLEDNWMKKENNLPFGYIPFDLFNRGRPYIYPTEENDDNMAFKVEGSGRIVRVKTFFYDGEQHEELVKQMFYNGGPIVQSASDALSYRNVVSGSLGSGNGSTLENSKDVVPLDMNGDGLIDYFYNGVLYTNFGNGVWLTKNIGKGVLIRDYNDDGISDFLVKSNKEKTVKLFFGTADGSEMDSTVLAKNLVCSDYIWSFDFDKDGDVDILLPFDYSDNAGSYLLLMENKGNGTFKKHEYYIGDKADFRNCLDIDADGNYEVLAIITISKSYPEEEAVYYYKIKGTTIETTGTVCLSKPQNASTFTVADKILFGDFINNGKMTMVTKPSAFDVVYVDDDNDGKLSSYRRNAITLSDNVNQVPNAPARPTFYYDENSGKLKILWEKTTDAESSSADLTYELRIGTAKDKGDILCADALPDGSRRNFMDGNQGYNLCRVLEVASWPAGTYYISVQAIDPNHRGSAFSEYAVFEKTSPSSGFDIYSPEPTATQDEITFALTEPYDANLTYNWDFGGGVLKSNDTTNGTWTIVYENGGDKVVSLQTVDKNGNQSVKEYRYFEVSGANLKKEKIETTGDDESLNSFIELSADIDEDGVAEILTSSDGDYWRTPKFYTSESDGSYQQVNKIWNLGINAFRRGNIIPCDINRDGMVDFFTPGDSSNKLKRATLINNGDNDMEYDALDLSEAFTAINGATFIDLNNDGLYDIIDDNGYIYKNDGDYSSFTCLSEITEELNIRKYSKYINEGDLDGNGLDDLYCYYYKYDECILYNNGDFTFTKSTDLSVLKHGLNIGDNDKVLWTKDLDNDGKLDAIVNYADADGYSCYRVEWSDGTSTELPSYEDSNSYKEIYGDWFDIDNNGFMDFLDGGYMDDGHAVCFYPNHRVEVLNIPLSSINSLQPTYNRQGRLVLYNDGSNTYIVSVANTAPAAPSNVRASQGTKGVTITWNHSVDKETPAVRMRYNLSVKHKNKTGEGAYVISPLNSGKNGIPVASNQALIENNKYFIPISNLPAGEYEVKVQGVDLLNAISDFSETLNLTVLESSNIEMPTATFVGKEIKAKLTANTDVTIDWDGGTTTRNDNGTYSVKWATTGLKNVKAGNQTVGVYVHELPSFTAPQSVMAGATVSVQLTPTCTGTWAYTTADSKNAAEMVAVKSANNEEMTLTFAEVGEYVILHTATVNSIEGTTEQRINVTESLSPTIDIVDVDPTTGKHRINWSTSSDIPEGATGVNIYRETAVSDAYTLIATLPLTTTSYVDEASDPRTTSSSYRMSYALDYGEGEMGQKHTTMHAMINQGVGGAWNIIWTPYEGINVQSYRILRGESADAMTLLKEVSGYTRSYTDVTAVSGKTYYYAVEIIATATSATKARRAKGTSLSTRSNVVSTVNAQSVEFLTGIEIVSVTGETVLTDSCKTIELVAIVTPKTATLHNVGWSIEEGTDIATISQDGRVTLTGDHDGTVVIKATALDGSAVDATFTISAEGITGINNVQSSNTISVRVIQNGTKAEVRCRADKECAVTLHDTAGNCSMSKKIKGDSLIDLPALQTGIYILNVSQNDTRKSVKFFKK